jgi:hypothetical protein
VVPGARPIREGVSVRPRTRRRPRPRKGGDVVTMCDRPAPGEPLWIVPEELAIFFPSRTWPKRAAAGGYREQQPSAPQLYGPT